VEACYIINLSIDSKSILTRVPCFVRSLSKQDRLCMLIEIILLLVPTIVKQFHLT
jgi:hypothetical protein